MGIGKKRFEESIPINSHISQTLSRLEQFTSTLKKAKKESGDVNTSTIYSEAYTGQVLEKDDEELVDTKDWHLGKLKFRKHIDDLYRMGGDGRSLDDYRVEDSRKKIR